MDEKIFISQEERGAVFAPIRRQDDDFEKQVTSSRAEGISTKALQNFMQ